MIKERSVKMARIKDLSKNLLLKRLVMIVLTIAIVTTNISSLIVRNVNAGVDYSQYLGTTASLGSPLLNDSSWDTDDWNKYELICFGIFLSNYVVPFVDSYKSAFDTTSSKGSKGAGLKALEFGSGSDVQANRCLKALLEYAIPAATKTVTPVKVKWKYTVDYKTKDSSLSTRDAVLKDLFIGGDYSETAKGEGKLKKKVIGISQELTDSDKDNMWGGYVYYDEQDIVCEDTDYITRRYRCCKEALLPQFYITVDGKDQVIFDLNDGYDLEMLSAVLGTANSGSNKKKVGQAIEDGYTTQLGFDCFGNIVCSIGGQYVIVVPASCNQYLTKEKSYNLLNSQVVGDNYTSESSDGLIKDIIAWKNEGLLGMIARGKGSTGDKLYGITGGGPLADGGNDESMGKVIIYQDTDSLFMKKCINAGKQPNTLLNVESVDIQWGNELLKLPKAAIGDKNDSKMPFKIEVVGAGHTKTWNSTKLDTALGTTCHVKTYLSDVFQTDASKPVLSYCYSEAGGDEQSRTNLFNSYCYVSGSIIDGEDEATARFFTNKAFKYLEGKTEYAKGSEGVDVEEVSVIEQRLRNATSIFGTSAALFSKDNQDLAKDSIASGLFKYYMEDTFNYKKGKSASSLGAAKFEETLQSFSSTDTKKTYSKAWYTFGIGDSVSETFMRACRRATTRVGKIYLKSPMFSLVSDTFNSVEGTEFAASTPFIYLTYLDWYGITGEEGENFNTKLFKYTDINSLDAEQVFGSAVLTEEQKKAEVLDNTYKMLDLEGGREYRMEVMTSQLEDWIEEQYNKAAFGGDAATGVTTSTLSSRTSQGFLKLSTYKDNMITSWFINWYEDYIDIIMAVLLILVILVGMIGGKTLIWYMKSFVFMVAILMLLPSTGEIVPYLCDNMVQNMFAKNMDYWAIQESIENENILEGLEDDVDALKEENTTLDTQELMMYVRRAQLTQLDRTIMIKCDISKKIVETTAIDYEELQKLKTASWLLPALMRQFSAGDGSKDYVYKSLSDLYIDFQYMYWLYGRGNADGTDLGSADKVMNHAINRQTTTGYAAQNWIEPTPITADGKYNGESKDGETVSVEKYGSNNVNSGNGLTAASIKDNLYTGYVDLSYGSGSNDESGTNNTSTAKSNKNNSSKKSTDASKINWKSVTRLNNVEALSHAQFYILRSKFTCPSAMGGSAKTATRDWDTFYEDKVQGKEQGKDGGEFRGMMNNLLIPQISNYNQYKTGVAQCFGYMYTTESPAHYFYQVVKDTFVTTDTDTLAKSLTNITGNYKEIDGKETRQSILRWNTADGGNGEIRDFLDLEELFTNVIPYMYTMQICACGDNLENGFAGADKLGDDYSVYKDNRKSWLFMCNWATKLVEYDMYNENVKVTIPSTGKKVKVKGCLFPQNYPAARPMVFSRAQMKAQGLEEKDLTYAELKILNVNDIVEKKWTLLVNYANTDGVTKEVLYRQMAITALTAFCSEFSPDNVINEDRALYPSSLDLRNISFDSVMKLIMVSSTSNASYVNADTMKTVIAEGSILSELGLLLDAELCSSWIPNIRNVILGLIFYLMLASIIYNTVVDKGNSKSKLTLWTAFGINNIMFGIFTMLYYGAFNLMITQLNVSDLITDTNYSMKSSVPGWKILFIMVISIIYIFAGIKLLIFVFKNWKDLGFEAYMNKASVLGQNITSAIGSVRHRIGDLRNHTPSDAGHSSGNMRTSGDVDVNTKKDKPIKAEIVGGEVSITDHKDGELVNMQSDSGYYMAMDKDEAQSRVSSVDYNAEIQKGKNMDN